MEEIKLTKQNFTYFNYQKNNHWICDKQISTIQANLTEIKVFEKDIEYKQQYKKLQGVLKKK